MSATVSFSYDADLITDPRCQIELPLVDDTAELSVAAELGSLEQFLQSRAARLLGAVSSQIAFAVRAAALSQGTTGAFLYDEILNPVTDTATLVAASRRLVRRWAQTLRCANTFGS